MRLPPEIFKAYDIRGVVGRTLTAPVVELIGQAIGSEARERGRVAVAIGRDGRHSGPELSAALAAGLRKSGTDVIDIGQAATPMLYFAAHHLDTLSGVAVTGSHNPPEYNGLKVMVDGETLAGAAIQDLKNRIEQGRLTRGAGALRSRSIREDYLRRITSDVKLARPMRL
ncbi:MAG TPA: phosphomannomutase/phosphoglucomutase, partial [Burkholderiales bacterium]